MSIYIDTMDGDVVVATPKITMYSKKRGMYCEVMSDGTYYVINGDWYGTREGDKFYICHSRKKEDTLIIDDWVEHCERYSYERR